MQRKPPWDAMNMEQIGIYENMTVSKFGEDIEQWAFSYLVVGIHFGAVTLETNAVLPNLIKYNVYPRAQQFYCQLFSKLALGNLHKPVSNINV